VGDAGFFFVDSLTAAAPFLGLMVRDRGARGSLKLLAKLLLGRCIYFGLADGKMPLSTGLLALGYCRHYPVPASAVVIGEIVTQPHSRGRGLATRAIMLGVNKMTRKGSSLFYIDTQFDNLPMIRSIEKLGFGSALDSRAAKVST
jgi:hypothetical protein